MTFCSKNKKVRITLKIIAYPSDPGIVIEEEDGETAEITSTGKVSAVGIVGTVGTSGGAYQNISGNVSDVDSAATAVNRMINQLFGEIGAFEGNNNLTADQRRGQVADHSRNLQGLAQKLMAILSDPKGIDKMALNNVSKQIATGLEQLVHSARNASVLGLDPDGDLLEGVKELADCLQSLLGIASEVNKKPNDMEARARLENAALAAQASIAKLRAVGMGKKADESFQALLIEMGKAASAAATNLAHVASNAQLRDPSKKQQVDAASRQLLGSGEQMIVLTNILAPTAQEAECKAKIQEAGAILQKGAHFLNAAAKSGGLNSEDSHNMLEGMKALNDALANLMTCTDLPDLSAGKDAQDFSSSAQSLLESCTAVMGSAGKPDQIRSSAAGVGNANHNLLLAARSLARGMDPADQARFLDYVKQVDNSVKQLIAQAPRAAANPRDDRAHAALRDLSQRVAEATQELLNDAGKKVAFGALYASAKYAAAATTGLVVSSISTKGYVNGEAERGLMQASLNATEAISQLMNALKSVRQPTNEEAINESNLIVMDAAEKFAPMGYKLVASAKGTVPGVSDPSVKKDLAWSADNAGKSIHKLLVSRKAAKAKLGSAEIAQALEGFQAAEAELEAAFLMAQQGIVEPCSATREEALKRLNAAVKGLANSTKSLANSAKDSPEELPDGLKQLSDGATELVQRIKDLCGTVDDPVLQKQLLGGAKELLGQVRVLMAKAQMVASNPQDENLNRLLTEAGKGVATALFNLVSASKNVIPKEMESFQKKSGDDIEDLAERELLGAANVINSAVAKMLAAQEEIRAKRETPGIDIDELNVTEAILEACHAIGQSTAVLMQSATAVQKEFNKMRKEPSTQAVYRRDPTWAEGLISASKGVAASVQHLVGVSDAATKGETRQEALIVAANEVSASTARLVAASTVKNVSSTTQSRLNEASKKVTSATRALVEAAKAAADFQREHEESATQDKYALKPEKVREMEEQMEILRLERELENRRMALLHKRKQDYADSVNQSHPQTPTPQPQAVPSGPSQGSQRPSSGTLRRGGPPRGAPSGGPARGGTLRTGQSGTPPSGTPPGGAPSRGGISRGPSNGAPLRGVPRGRGGPGMNMNANRTQGVPRGRGEMVRGRGGTLRRDAPPPENSATGRVNWRASKAFTGPVNFSGMQ